MPTATIDTQGNYVHYDDSGAPNNLTDYTTVVFVHGHSFNSTTFKRLLPLASDHGLRIFTMNLRDYRGSSKYSDEELAEMGSTDVENQVSVLRKFGHDVAGFVQYVCKTQGVTKVKHDGEHLSGGVVLVTWSLSNAALLAFLGDPETLDAETKAVLQLYLRKVVLYDPACNVLGVYPEIGLHFPLLSEDIPRAQKPAVLAQWAASHYEPIKDIASITPETLQYRTLLLERTPTVHKMTREELEELYEPTVSDRSGALATLPAAIYLKNLRRAFLDGDAVLPAVDAVALWCDQSIWLCVWAAKVLDDLLREDVSVGRKRPLTIRKLERANHFLHWEEPERFVSIIKEIAQ